MNVAVIPARGGSKRIPRKNIKSFCGKPMIAWPIDVAKKSGLFDYILVSTDDEEIADVAKEYNAEVPFTRPKNLSNDYIGTTEVIAHAISWMKNRNWELHAVCCLVATAAMVQEDDLKIGLDALESGDWDYAFAVTEYPAPIFRSFRKLPSGGVEMFFPEHFSTRSQDLPTALHDAGQFCWGRPSTWLERKHVFDSSSRPIIIPRWRVQDIDTEDDWKRAELLFTTKIQTD